MKALILTAALVLTAASAVASTPQPTRPAPRAVVTAVPSMQKQAVLDNEAADKVKEVKQYLNFGSPVRAPRLEASSPGWLCMLIGYNCPPPCEPTDANNACGIFD